MKLGLFSVYFTRIITPREETRCEKGHRKELRWQEQTRLSAENPEKDLATAMKKLTTSFVGPALQGCVQTLAIRTMGGIMDYGLEAFNEEGDLKLAEDALGSNLKLVEALIKGDPENKKLLLMASQGFNAYALAFAEDDSVERARTFYLQWTRLWHEGSDPKSPNQRSDGSRSHRIPGSAPNPVEG